MSNRAITGIAGIAALGAGYYFYQSGGDPKVAGKMAERKASHALITDVAN